jgi:hypothetical protein
MIAMHLDLSQLEIFKLINRTTASAVRRVVGSAEWLAGGRTPKANLQDLREAFAFCTSFSMPLPFVLERLDRQTRAWASTPGELFALRAQPCKERPTRHVYTRLRPLAIRYTVHGEGTFTVTDRLLRDQIAKPDDWTMRAVRKSTGADFAFEEDNLEFELSEGIGALRPTLPRFADACQSLGEPPITGQRLDTVVLQGELLDSRGESVLTNPQPHEANGRLPRAKKR